MRRIVAAYDRQLIWVLRHQPLTMAVAVGTLLLTIVLYAAIPKGFFPLQDTGFIQAITESGPTVSFQEMANRQRAVADKILADPAVESLSSFIGVDGTNTTLNSGPLPDQSQNQGRPRQRRRCDRPAWPPTPMRCRASPSISSRCRTSPSIRW